MTTLTTEEVQFGPCVVVLIQPEGHDRFYGPFNSEAEAKDWMNKQDFSPRSSVGIMPLRRTDISRTQDDFFDPRFDWAADDFWSVVIKDKPVI